MLDISGEGERRTGERHRLALAKPLILLDPARRSRGAAIEHQVERLDGRRGAGRRRASGARAANTPDRGSAPLARRYPGIFNRSRAAARQLGPEARRGPQRRNARCGRRCKMRCSPSY